MSCSGCSMTFLARVPGESCGDHAGDDHEDEGDHDKGQRCAPGAILRAGVRRGRVREDLRRYRGVRTAERVLVHRHHREDREQQRRSLTRGPGNGEQRAADDPADRGRQHNGDRHARLRRTEGVAPLAQRVRHQFQHLIGGADDDRQHQAAQGESTGEARELEVHYPDREDEEPHHDRWHARHHVGHEPDEPRQHALAAVLVEVDRAEHAERHGHGRGDRHDQERAEYRRPDSAYVRRHHLRRDGGGEELPADDLDTAGDHRDQDEHQRDHDEDERDHHQHGRYAVLGAPPAGRLAEVGLLPGGDGHQALPCSAAPPTIARAMMLTMIVNANRSTPSPISAAWNTPEDSPNWLAMTAGMESPGANRWDVIVADEPITSAAAIVSPIARPRPSSTAPTTPPWLCGQTEPVIISHRVAPSAYAPSLSICGTVAMTSRDSEVTIGVIMKARMIPQVKNDAPLVGAPLVGAPNRASSTGMPLTPEAIEA